MKKFKKPPQISVLQPHWVERIPPLGSDVQRMYVHNPDQLTVVVGDELYCGQWWRRWSISRPDRIPTYDELMLVKMALIGNKHWAYHLFPPQAYLPSVLHLWQPLGARPLPDFRVKIAPAEYAI